MDRLLMIDRRAFCRALAASIAGTIACSPPGRRPTGSPRERLIRVLGLEGPEIEWLSSLSDKEQEELIVGLESPAAGSADRPTSLLMKLLGRRSRLFAYVGYPDMSDRLQGCDGLIRE
jgi:hypothetical protein